MNKIEINIKKLVKYGLLTGLVKEEDAIYTTNRLLELFAIEDMECEDEVTMTVEELPVVLNE